MRKSKTSKSVFLFLRLFRQKAEGEISMTGSTVQEHTVFWVWDNTCEPNRVEEGLEFLREMSMIYLFRFQTESRSHISSSFLEITADRKEA